MSVFCLLCFSTSTSTDISWDVRLIVQGAVHFPPLCQILSLFYRVEVHPPNHKTLAKTFDHICQLAFSNHDIFQLEKYLIQAAYFHILAEEMFCHLALKHLKKTKQNTRGKLKLKQIVRHWVTKMIASSVRPL